MAWQLFDRDGDGGFQICGVDDDVLGTGPLDGLTIACSITVAAVSAAPVALAATEKDLERITSSLLGRIVATKRTRTSLETLVYLPSDDGAERFTQVTLPRGASVSVAPARDPEWTLFGSTRPSGMEVQSMLDYRYRNELHAAGDVGGVRRIDHVVTHVPADLVEAFTAAVETTGVTVSAVEDARIELTQDADPTDITESSWTVRLIAERFGGVYDGWACAVLHDTAPRPRRWFRRS